MPPGVSHPNYVCWDELGVDQQAKFLAFYQVRTHEENPPAPKKPKPANGPRRKGKR